MTTSEPTPERVPEPTGTSDLARHYLRDLVYGANDGVITTFAVAAGAAGATLSARTVIILGVANLFADGFSMGASNYLSIRSDEALRSAKGEAVSEPFPLRHGVATLLAFVTAGVVPLAPYLLAAGDTTFALVTSITLLTLFAVGAARALITDLHWWTAGLEMLLVGAVAATVAYGIGALVSGIAATG